MLRLTALNLLLLVQPSVQVTSNFVTYIPGDAASTVIISAPHGGWLISSTGLPNRPAEGCYDTSVLGDCIYDINHTPCNIVSGNCEVNKLKDSDTYQLATEIANEIETLTGVKPHLIKARAHRRVVDLNRDRPEATFEHSGAITVWNQYHQYIDQAKAATLAGGRNVLYIDVHGQAAATWNMIGMLILKYSGLNLDPIPNSLANQSSITNLHQNSGVSMEELIRGQTSIGGLMNSNNYDMVPSPQHKFASGGIFYKGGYSLRRHAVGKVSGFQVEATSAIRNGPSAARTEFVNKLAGALQYWVNNYN